LPALGLVAEAIFAADQPGAERVRGVFGERYGLRWLDNAVAERWGGVVRRWLERPEGRQQAPKVRARADTILVEHLEGIGFAAASDQLPTGFEQRLRTVAELIEHALTNGATRNSLETLGAAVKFARAHALASEGRREAERAAMAARLLGWLASERRAPESLEQALLRYAEQDAWVDRARAVIRVGAAMPELNLAFQKLRGRVAKERDELNQFVGGAISKVTLPQGAAIGTEDVLKRLVQPLAKDAPVALIVMDGMSQAVALELVESLERMHWTRYRQKQAPAPLVVSALPSVTEYSRTSLLCGSLKNGGQREESGGFTEFLKSAKANTATVQTLFHKDSLQSDSSEVERSILSEARVIGVVINAIDAQLSGSDQLSTEWNLHSIPVLERIVRACEQAGRAIVLTADHGHVVDEATEEVRAHGAGELVAAARWRGVGGDLRPGEVELRGPRVLAPGGVCVVATNERLRYASRRAGYHGGATVQEIACPLHILIHSSIDTPLDGWIPIEPSCPDWWNLDPATARPVAPTAASGTTGTRAKSRAQFQKSKQPQSASGTVGWIDALLESATYQQQCSLAGRATLPVDVVRKLLTVAVSFGVPGAPQIRITGQAYASRMELSVGELRKRTSLLSRVLNVDSYDVLATIDEETYQLDIQLLKTQFDLGGN
jgi:hypothetical protein